MITDSIEVYYHSKAIAKFPFFKRILANLLKIKKRIKLVFEKISEEVIGNIIEYFEDFLKEKVSKELEIFRSCQGSNSHKSIKLQHRINIYKLDLQVYYLP